jgi:hypothetical protein
MGWIWMWGLCVKALPTMSVSMCNVCSKLTDLRCTVCKNAKYCSRACQKVDWKKHKIRCFRAGCLPPCPCAVQGFEDRCGADGRYLLQLMKNSKDSEDIVERCTFSAQPAVKILGERVFKEGGDARMRALWTLVTDYAICRAVHHGDVRMKPDPRDLNEAWDGIGEWKR